MQEMEKIKRLEIEGMIIRHRKISPENVEGNLNVLYDLQIRTIESCL